MSCLPDILPYILTCTDHYVGLTVWRWVWNPFQESKPLTFKYLPVKLFLAFVALPSVTKLFIWYLRKWKQSMKKWFVKTILSSSRGHSIMCLGMPLCPATVIILGKYLGNFHFIPGWQILRGLQSCLVSDVEKQRRGEQWLKNRSEL